MKVTIIIFSILVGLFFIFQIYTVMASKKTKAQPYTVISVQEEFEIRYYPSVAIASMTADANSFKELGSKGFRTLASYIFGGNAESKSIAMTSPVSMEMNDSAASMTFIMPEEYSMNSLPKPNDDQVKLSMSKEGYMAALAFDGFTTDKIIKQQIEKLEKALSKQSIHHDGQFKVLGYNPPYQLVDRLNEIVVFVEWNKDKK